MKLLLQRKILTDQSTIGQLSIDGQEECWVLEPPLKSDHGPVAIPAGAYVITLRYSPKHKRILPHIENVPGRTEIEMHPGNKPADTLGCQCPGESYSPARPDWVSNSVEAFDRLFATLEYAWDRGEAVTTTILDPEPVALEA